MAVRIEFDPDKSDKNGQMRDLPFDRVAELDFTTALVAEDLRHPYGERRFQAIGRIGPRLYVVVFTPIPGASG